MSSVWRGSPHPASNSSSAGLNIGRVAQAAPEELTISPSRKILCAAALAVVVLATGPGAAHAAPLQLEHAGLLQKGGDLIFTVRTSRPVALSRLDEWPQTLSRGARYLCFALSHPGARTRLVCLGGEGPHTQVGLEVIRSDGDWKRKQRVPATVNRPQPDKLVAAVELPRLHLVPGRYRWRAIRGSGCSVGNRCTESLPATDSSSFRLRPVRAVGCTGGSPGLVTNGPRERKVVALTFDDGPSDYTDDFLGVLRKKGVRGTFFELGQEMPGREDVMRQVLAEGSEIGDHTMGHVEFPGYSQIAGAAARIEGYTHFKPCLFRPPGGGVDASVIATAGGLGMRTVNWDVDPQDWSLPGAGAIYSNIVSHAQNGSIVLMHDGGGPRGETLAALPQVIDTLRGRGFHFATVSELLGYRILYRPYG
jgi:peptidoglycan-N-acetylglucosamine deacetylase